MSTSPVKLAFPPHCETGLRGPHLALPHLAAFVRQHGCAISTVDLNIGFFRHLTEPAVARRLLAPLAETFAMLSGQDRLTSGQLNQLIELSQLQQLDARLATGTQTQADLWTTIRLLGAQLHANAADIDGIISSLDNPDTLVDAYYASLDLDGLCRGVRVLGISVAFHLQVRPALMLARAVHARRPDVQVVLGGSQMSLLGPEQQDALARLPFVSAIVLYEGEIPLLEICRQAAEAQRVDFERVQNAVFFDGHSVRRTAYCTPPSMKDLPTPDFDEALLDSYIGPPTLPVFVSKGCYWGKCKFCDYTKLYTPGQAEARSAFRPATVIVNDMRALQKRFGVSDFYLVSEAIPPAYYRQLAREIIGRKLVVRMTSFCRVEKSYDFAFFKLLSDAGVWNLTFGVESTVDRILALIEKGNTMRDVRETFRLARSAGIATTFNLIPDYPSTTWEDVEQMIDFVREQADFISYLNPQTFDLSRNSPILDDQERHGIDAGGELVYTEHGIHNVRFKRVAGLTAEQAELVRRRFGRLQGELALYRRLIPLHAITRHPAFDARRATFTLSPDIQYAWLSFDPAECAGTVIARAPKPMLVATCYSTRRHVTLPDVAEAIFLLASDGRPFTLGEVLDSMRDDWDVADEEKATALLDACVSALVDNGMVARVFHPWLSDAMATEGSRALS